MPGVYVVQQHNTYYNTDEMMKFLFFSQNNNLNLAIWQSWQSGNPGNLAILPARTQALAGQSANAQGMPAGN